MNACSVDRSVYRLIAKPKVLSKVLCMGDRVSYKQVTHSIPLESSSLSLTVHENPRKGTGTVLLVSPVGDELRVFVLPDEEVGKKERQSLLLRIPPDEIGLLNAST